MDSKPSRVAVKMNDFAQMSQVFVMAQMCHLSRISEGEVKGVPLLWTITVDKSAYHSLSRFEIGGGILRYRQKSIANGRSALILVS